MNSIFRLQRGLDEFFLCRNLDDCEGVTLGTPMAIPFSRSIPPLEFIRSCITDAETERRLWLWMQADPQTMIAVNDAGDLLDHIARRIARGDLIVARGIRQGMPQGIADAGILRGSKGQVNAKSRKSRRQTERTPLQDEMAARQQREAEPEVITVGESEPETTWIEIELVEPGGQPAANERYKLTLPDGSIKWGRLDQHGKARVERLQPGNCQVTFPDRDEQVWDVG
jgi:hypothetical protein